MAYREVEGAQPSPKVIAALVQSLRHSEEPLVGAWSLMFKHRSHDLQAPMLLITSQRLLVAKDKIFGKSKPTVTVELTDVVNTGFRPLRGVGPTWEAYFETATGSPATAYFASPEQAESFSNGLREAVHVSRNGSEVADPTAASPTGDAQLQRLHDLIDDLRIFATPDRLGMPFGEGSGLEEAMQCVFHRLESPDDCRQCGSMVVVDLLVESKDPQVADDAMRLMGATDEALGAQQASGAVREAAKSLGGAACVLLSQWQGPGNIWDLWLNRDDVAAEMLCWHSIARLRLATSGRMDPLVRPM